MKNMNMPYEKALDDFYRWLSIDENIAKFNEDLGLDLVLIKDLRKEGDLHYTIVAEIRSTRDKVLIQVYSGLYPELDLNSMIKRTCNVYINPKIVLYVTESSYLEVFEEFEWMNMISKGEYCFVHVIDNNESNGDLEGNGRKFVIGAGKKKFEKVRRELDNPHYRIENLQNEFYGAVNKYVEKSKREIRSSEL